MSDNTLSSAALWLRSCSLIVADMAGNGIELAGPGQPQILRIKFTVNYKQIQTPANLHARVYNLSANTVQRIVGLASQNPPTISGVPQPSSAQVVLKAGYTQNFGQLFRGQIYQLRMGKETNVDSYIDIFAADGDAAHDWAWMTQSLAKGYVAEDVWKAAGQSMQPWQTQAGPPPDGLDNQPAPRGKVMYGPTRDTLRDFGNTNNCTWNIYNGQLQAIPRFGVRPGEAIVINHNTGQIGVPEQTENGVTVTSLLNPAITWGTKIKLDNTEIAQLALAKEGGHNAPLRSLNPNYTAAKDWTPPLNSDAVYVCLYVRHVGDTRGNEWYTHITAVNSDPTAPPPRSAFSNVEAPPGIPADSIKSPYTG